MNIRLSNWKARAEVAGIILNLFEATCSLDAPRFEQVAMLAAQMLLAGTRSGSFLSNARSVLFLIAAGLQPICSIVRDEVVAFSKKTAA